MQAVVVGADRIAANGDTANKIGTYGVALLAAAHGIPFYVAAPSSTFDLFDRQRRGDSDRAARPEGSDARFRPADRARRRGGLQSRLRRHAGRADCGHHLRAGRHPAGQSGNDRRHAGVIAAMWYAMSIALHATVGVRTLVGDAAKRLTGMSPKHGTPMSAPSGHDRCRPTPRSPKTLLPDEGRHFALPAILFVATCLSTFWLGAADWNPTGHMAMFLHNAAANWPQHRRWPP